jgi:hypothetical protein
MEMSRKKPTPNSKLKSLKRNSLAECLPITMGTVVLKLVLKLLSCRAETRHFTEGIVSRECLVSAPLDLQMIKLV